MDLKERKPMVWMVCNDGSQQSFDALKECRYDLMHEEEDAVIVAHIWSLDKEQYLPHNLRRGYINQFSEVECIQLGQRYTYEELQMNEKKGDSAKELLNQLAKENKVDLVVVGYHGRKGPKEDPTVMGTAVQYMSVHAAAPVLILKDPIGRDKKVGGQYVFACCVDGSQKSLRTIEYICRIRKSKDLIKVIICEQENICSVKVREKVEYLIEEEGCTKYSEIKILSSEFGRRSADIIRDHLLAGVKQNFIDFICVGNKGADFSSNNKQTYLGSVANEIIINTKLNVLFIC